MKARDVMTSAVASVSPETPTSAIAKILRDHAISAMPVVDEAGAPRCAGWRENLRSVALLPPVRSATNRAALGVLARHGR